jgi:hypothetical protein
MLAWHSSVVARDRRSDFKNIFDEKFVEEIDTKYIVSLFLNVS